MELNPGPALIFFAVPEEAAPLLRLARTRTGVNPPPAITAGLRWARRYEFPGVTVQVTGMGPDNARRVAAALLPARDWRWAITGGLAGGLHPRLAVGDLLVEADAGFSPLAPLQAAGAGLGRFHLVSTVATTVAAKARLHAATGADAVDMESAVIREHCAARNLPAATLRVISDTAHEDLPLDFSELVDADQQLQFGRLLGRLLRSPGKVPALIRLGRTVNRCATRLATALDAALPWPGR